MIENSLNQVHFSHIKELKRWKILSTTSWFPSHTGFPVTGIPNGGIHVFQDMDIHTCHTMLQQYFLIVFDSLKFSFETRTK